MTISVSAGNCSWQGISIGPLNPVASAPLKGNSHFDTKDIPPFLNGYLGAKRAQNQESPQHQILADSGLAVEGFDDLNDAAERAVALSK